MIKLEKVEKIPAWPEIAPAIAQVKPRQEYARLAVWFCLGALLGSFSQSYFDQRQHDQQQVEPQDDKHDQQKIDASGSTFVFVLELQTKTADQELLLRDMRAWCGIHKCDFRTFDQDSKEAEVYKLAAEKVGVKSPFLAVVRDRKITRIFDMPRDRLTLEGLVK
jgi:hypothetical protein